MSHSNDDLLKNIKRQAKRLAKLLSCPLGQAQEGLAICVYGCTNYGQLLELLKSDTFDKSTLALATLHPKSELFTLKLLEHHLADIQLRFASKYGAEKINTENILFIFALEPDDFKEKVSIYR